MTSLHQINRAIVACERCPRLREHCQKIAINKKREFRDESYWGKPVPSFGDTHARLWIIGLAPAAHGANRTGRMFTGDSSGQWLYRVLHEFGFASQPHSVGRDDGLKLRDTYITAAAHCAPPDNKPTLEELRNCEEYLDQEFRLLKKRKLTLVTGGIAFQSYLKLLARQGFIPPSPKPKFAHNKLFEIGGQKVLTTYHPSRQNTNTGRLTQKMWSSVFRRAQRLITD